MTVSDEKGGDGGPGGDGEVVNPRCFFDVEIGGVSAGRLVVELFANHCPKTVENFRQLCTGEGGLGKTTKKPLTFKGTVFHRVIKDFMIQGGDFTNFNGTGGESIYGGTFEDENLQVKHDEQFLLSMANRGPNTNGSQFFILTQPAPHLNGIHVVFGRVVSGQPIIKQIEGLPVDRKSRPLSDVRVSNCGELILMKKKKEKKPKKENKLKKEEKSEGEEDEKSSGEISESGSDSGKKRNKKASESSAADDENLEVPHPLVSLTSIDPDSIPKDPSNYYLMRSKPEDTDDKEKKSDDKDKERRKSRQSKSRSKSGSRSRSREIGKRWDRPDRGDRGANRGRNEDRSRFGGAGRSTDNEGRKIKGRGRICFPRLSSRSRSKTPPHWKAETRKTISMKEFEDREKRKREKDDETRRRQDERKKRHEETVRHRPTEPEKDREHGEAERERGTGERERGTGERERGTGERERGTGERQRGAAGRERGTGERNRGSDRDRDRVKGREREPRRDFSSSLRDRFRPSESDDFSTREDKEEPEPKSKAPDVEQSAKIVEELTSKLQAAGDGVVYYQHLYKASSNTNATVNLNSDATSKLIDDVADDVESIIRPKEKLVIGGVVIDFDVPPPKLIQPVILQRSVIPEVEKDEDENVEDEGPPGEEDESVLAELRLRRELLKKRLKDWEEDSDDEGDGNKDKEKSNDNKKLHTAMEAELKALNARDGLSAIGGGNTEIKAKDKQDESSSKKDRKSRSKSKSRSSKSKSRSKSRSRSKGRHDRRDRRRENLRERDRSGARRNSSKDGSRGQRDRNRGSDRDRRRKDSSRDRKEKEHRDRDRRRTKRSKSRSKSRSRSRSRGHHRRR